MPSWRRVGIMVDFSCYFPKYASVVRHFDDLSVVS
jgi:hypothetical protein